MKRKDTTDSPMVSIVMAVYNGESLLRAAIDSILNQTFANFEFIIINDGSSDGTKKILDSYTDSRIKVIDQSNHGLVYSLNKGFSLAKSEFVARMDADDISTPSRLEKQLEILASESEVAVVGSFFSYIDEQGKHLGSVMTMPTKDIDIKRSLYIVNPFAHGSTVIRKSIWEKAGGYSDSHGPTEDYDLWCRIADLEKVKFAMVPEILYWYRINPNGISSLNSVVQNEYAQKIAKDRWEKPYVGKNIHETVNDAKYYRLLSYFYGDRIFDIYYYQQLFIMQLLFKRRHFLTGLKHAIALLRMKPDWSRKHIARSIAGGFLRKIGLKS